MVKLTEAIESDIGAVFFHADAAFTSEVDWNGGTLQVIWTAQASGPDGLQGPVFLCASANIAAMEPGQQVTREGSDYMVEFVSTDGWGTSTVTLRGPL